MDLDVSATSNSSSQLQTIGAQFVKFANRIDLLRASAADVQLTDVTHRAEACPPSFVCPASQPEWRGDSGKLVLLNAVSLRPYKKPRREARRRGL